MRRFVVLIGLIVVLIGMILIQRAITNWHPILSGEPGELLYVAAFDSFTDEWRLQGHRLEPVIESGVMRFEVDEISRFPFRTTLPYFDNFDMRIEARAVAGPLNNGYGVVFRAQDRDNLYAFLVSSDGYYKVVRYLDGEKKDLSTWIQSPLVNKDIGPTNYLRVVASGSYFRFYVNNQPVQLCIPDDPSAISTYVGGECRDGHMVDTLVDDTFASGQLGPAVLTLDEPDVVVEFDNLVVYGAAVIDGDPS